MRPSRKFLNLITAWLIMAMPLALLRYLGREDVAANLAAFWWLAGVFTGGYALLDVYRSRAKEITARRQLPSILAVGVQQTVVLEVNNPLPFTLTGTVTDHWPSEIEMAGMPVDISIPPQSSRQIRYQLQANKRGAVISGQVDLRLRSRAGLWDLRLLRGKTDNVRVYPNFAPIFNSETLSIDQQINRLGAHPMQKRGSGMDFHQLREYREGDILRQVDWKASSRLHKLISREYQFERDQDIIFLMDCGRRMRAQDEGISHFDHALNAMLLTAWIALRQGDAVGLQSFASNSRQPERWLTPTKGQATINRVLQQTYDLHSSTASSDFLEAAEQLSSRHRKRSLIILVSNIREEDKDDLKAAIALLSSRHMVIVASLREQVLDNITQQPVNGFQQALAYAGTRHYLDKRQQLLKELQGKGTLVIDARPDTLHIDMVTQYLQLKSGGHF